MCQTLVLDTFIHNIRAMQTIGLVRLKIEIGWLFHFPAQSAENCSSKKIHYYWSASSFFITMKLSPLLSQKRTVLLWLLFLFAIERLSLPPERGHNFIVIPGRFSHNTKSADAIFCLSTSMILKVKNIFTFRLFTHVLGISAWDRIVSIPFLVEEDCLFEKN